MNRKFWIVFGGAAQVLFFYTVYRLFMFLYAGSGDLLGIEPPRVTAMARGDESGEGVVGHPVAVDVLLLAQFGLAHSAVLHTTVRRKIERLVPKELYGSFFSVIASGTLLLTATFWRALPGVVYETQGVLAWLLLAAFLASWGALFYSINLTGLGFQTGFTSWCAYLRGRAVPRWPFVTTGAYRFLRHPIYLGFLLLLWCTPRMTTDHLLMASVWTVYIYVGSVLKDRRMLSILGDRYSSYMARVPGYPFVPWGPLARAPNR